MSPTVTRTRTPVGVCASQRNEKEEEDEHDAGRSRGESEGWKVGLRISESLAGYFSKDNANLAQFMLILFIGIPPKALGAHAKVVVASASFALTEGLRTPLHTNHGLIWPTSGLMNVRHMSVVLADQDVASEPQ